MNAFKVIGGLIVLSIVASNVGYAVGIRKERKAIKEAQTPNAGEAK